jgi:3-dehydroquinate synthase
VRLVAGLAPIRVEPLLVPAGEASKSWSGLGALVERLLGIGLERGDHVLAFGGGVVGDLAGFAAAIMKRGCGYVQIPTSLLAQVDSSVGGKTAVNTALGKNSVGAFHQPAVVLVDPECLDTLPDRQMRAGYAEIVKYALIDDPPFFDWLEANGAAVLAREAGPLLHAITRSVAAKASIVAADERDLGGRRALLNLGHSFGHALEAETDFSDRLLHGEAVAIGMALAFRLSVQRGLCSAEDAERVEAHLRRAGLPASAAEAAIAASPTAVAAHMLRDKKARASEVRLILARGIGRAFLDPGTAAEELTMFLASQPALRAF